MSEFEELNQRDDDAPPPPIKMAVGQRCVNSIEMSLIEAMTLELETLTPMPFIEPLDDNDPQGLVVLANPEDFAHYFDGATPAIKQVFDLCRDLEVLVTEKWRPQITLARSLGTYRPRDGGPHVREYVAACVVEGVEPWPEGCTPLTDR